MGKNQSSFSFKRSAESLQDNVTTGGTGRRASYTLIGAIILLGGIGYGLDRWRGTAPWGLFVGLMLGLIVGFYELVKGRLASMTAGGVDGRSEPHVLARRDPEPDGRGNPEALLGMAGPLRRAVASWVL